jgi:nuclear pore complex protein Nup85
VDELPPDPTNLEEMIHLCLFTGRPVDALGRAAQLDVWLAAHLADMMEPFQLLDNEGAEYVIA